MSRFKIKDIKQCKLNIDELHIQYIPDRFFRDVFLGSSEEDMVKIENSPHYRFLELYQKEGKNIWKHYQQTDYIKLMKYWGRNDKYNYIKVKKFIQNYESIRKKGIKKRIIVLEKPIFKKHFKDGYEIYHGHHRAVICKILGYLLVPCIVSIIIGRPTT